MQRKISELFGITAPDTVTVDVREQASGPVPTQDNHYIFDPLLLKKVLLWLGKKAPRRNIMLLGDAGTGKTSMILETAARLQIPVWSCSCSGKTKYEHLVGAMGLQGGNTVWEDGPLTAAWRAGGIFLANEITRMDAGEQMRLVDTLDKHGRLIIQETGEVVERHPDFRFAATGNSGGFGDETGAYSGERVGSFAFVDRFIKVTVAALKPEQEEALLAKVAPALPETIRKGMVKLANDIRASFVSAGGALRITISPRALVDWACLATEYRLMSGIDPLKESLMDIVLNGAPLEDARVVIELLDNWIKENP